MLIEIKGIEKRIIVEDVDRCRMRLLPVIRGSDKLKRNRWMRTSVGTYAPLQPGWPSQQVGGER